MDDALACIARIYAYFEMTLSLAREKKMKNYLREKSRVKPHHPVDANRAADWSLFRHYQNICQVPDEIWFRNAAVYFLRNLP